MPAFYFFIKLFLFNAEELSCEGGFGLGSSNIPRNRDWQVLGLVRNFVYYFSERMINRNILLTCYEAKSVSFPLLQSQHFLCVQENFLLY